jgi:hypothetical protein
MRRGEVVEVSSSSNSDVHDDDCDDEKVTVMTGL